MRRDPARSAIMLSSSSLGGSRPSSSVYHSASASYATAPNYQENANCVALTADLWLKIDQLHLNYLKAEESSAKIAIRKKLEGYIHQYLCLVPQERKFCNRLTSDIIIESAKWMPLFSAVKAAQAFEAVETYASNIINQPWRKEFREIKKYAGFFKHNIDTCLTSADRLFLEMGYIPDFTSDSLVIDVVDQDRATTVARDCILACVECQILVAIVQGLAASHLSASWEEVIAFRRDHVGTPEQAVRSMAYEKSQMQYRNAVADNNYVAHTQPLPPSTHTYIPPQQNYPQLQQFQPNGIAHYGQQHPYAQPQPLNIQPQPVHAQTNGYVIPTGQLVDLGSNGKRHSYVSSGGGSSNSTLTGGAPSSGAVQIPLTVKSFEEDSRRKSTLLDGSLQSWDYVYRQLENIGYTKDQAERPDVLALLNKVTMARQRSEMGMEKAAAAATMRTNGQMKSSTPEALSPLSHVEIELLRQIGGTGSAETRNDSHNFGGGDEVDAVHHRFRGGERRGSGGSLKKMSDPNKRMSSRHSRALSPPKKVSSTPGATSSVSPGRWECHTCTFANKTKHDICQMCGKSRNSPLTSVAVAETQATPAARAEDMTDSGDRGIQCQKCTLVNDKRLKICDACGASLHKKAIGMRDDGVDSSNSSEEWFRVGKEKVKKQNKNRQHDDEEVLKPLRKSSTMSASSNYSTVSLRKDSGAVSLRKDSNAGACKDVAGGCKRMQRKNSRMM